ncbi:MAG: hypothetical protein JWP35_1100 [Caulobacter sp.]|nr:hypothetical protein [Caulobacter sp.]
MSTWIIERHPGHQLVTVDRKGKSVFFKERE